MREIKLLNIIEDGCLVDNELGPYKVVKNGLDDIVILKNYRYRELKKCEITSLSAQGDEYKIVDVENYNIHIVQPMENLNSISEKYGVSIEDLKKINNLNINRLFIGQILKF